MTVYRPELHVTAERGILEGPAGIYRTGACLLYTSPSPRD